MFSMSIRPEILKSIREKYPPGTAVEVVEFHDQYRDIPAGTKGRVLAVDDTGKRCIAWSPMGDRYREEDRLKRITGRKLPAGGFFPFLEACS